MSQHHPHLCTTGRHGSWCSCPCGWSSGTYGTVTGAHLAFGRHLLDAEHITRADHTTRLANR